MAFNSTIRQRIGYCSICGVEGPVIKGLCNNHYWLNVRLKSVNKQYEKEEVGKKGNELSDLITKADAVFSKYIRLSEANTSGKIKCFICQNRVRWQDAQAMHFVKRGNLFLRWDERNVKVGDNNCNVVKGGNYLLFAKKLESLNPGITDILMEESRLVYKPTRQEIHDIINSYTQKIKQLK